MVFTLSWSLEAVSLSGLDSFSTPDCSHDLVLDRPAEELGFHGLVHAGTEVEIDLTSSPLFLECACDHTLSVTGIPVSEGTIVHHYLVLVYEVSEELGLFKVIFNI